MWTNSRSLFLSRIMTWGFLVVLTAGSVMIPRLLSWYLAYTGKGMESYRPLFFALLLCVPPAFTALLSLERLLRNISAGDVFTAGNTGLIRVVSWCCFAVSAVMLCFCFFNVFGFFVGIVAAFMGLILRVVKNVIAQAIDIKAENDLTV